MGLEDLRCASLTFSSITSIWNAFVRLHSWKSSVFFVYLWIYNEIMPNWSLAESHGPLLCETSRRSGPFWVRLYAAFVLALCCICRWLLRVWGLAHTTPLFWWVLEVTLKPFLVWSLDRAAAIMATSRPCHLFGIHSLCPCASPFLSLSVLVSVGPQSLFLQHWVFMAYLLQKFLIFLRPGLCFLHF